MTIKERLINELKSNDGIISTKDALKLGINKYVLKNLKDKGIIVKIANGLYALPNEEIDEYIYLTHRIPKGVFSHETAAYLNGLITRMPLVYVMTVVVGDNVTRVKSNRDDIVFKYVKKNIYELGREEALNPFGRKIFIYDKERTVLDLIKDKNRVDSDVFSESIKSYFFSKEKNLFKLYKYAKYMNMEKQLKTYSEVLL